MVDYKLEEHLAIITMQRPEKKNALNEDMLNDLNAVWTRFKNDEDAWIAIFSGAGNVFCSGADKSYIARSTEGEDFWNGFLNLTQKIPYMTGTVGKPTISAINGSCFGGGVGLALSADFRIMAEGSILRMPEPDFGGVLLQWETGVPAPILKQLNVGIPLTAERAFQVGLLNEICPAENVLDTAIEWGRKLLMKPPLAIRKVIQVSRMLFSQSNPMDAYSLLDYCTQLGNMLAKTEDGAEAMQAFLEKKVPNYKAK